MAIKKAHAYDINAKRWLGKVPLTWFKRFPHLKHEAPDGSRPDVPRRRLGKPATAAPAAVETPAPAAAAAVDATEADGPNTQVLDVLGSLTVSELRKYAEDHDIVLDVHKKADIVAAIAAATKPAAGDDATE